MKSPLISLNSCSYLFIQILIQCCCHCSYTELAAAVPITEVVGKGDYFRFGMRDSLAIEASFLQVIPSVSIVALEV